jgi:prepilin-type N-terminal cleavage/methylation domain-containing protein
MILNNIKTRQKDSGFTIVELLVVIVVIGILAAITIVSYSGITARANSKSDASNASSVLSAAQVVYANTGAYPATNASTTTTLNALNAGDAKVPSGILVSNAQEVFGSTIRYIVGTNGTGICVGYWDYSSGAQFLFGGTATADTNPAGAGAAANCTNG